MRLWPALLLGIGLQACQATPDYPNRPLAQGVANLAPPNAGDADPAAPVILIAFSGGGSRAAALGLGVLDELASATYPSGTGPMPLVARVKVVSSVSGGSVVAGWFALVGPARMDELRDRFLSKDNMAALEWQAANPVTLGRLIFGRYTRIDVLRDLLDRELFGNTTFAALHRPNAPFLMLNATDMESGEVFTFVPERFDDICSDLAQLPISVGVAASAAFPVALSPMSLRNYSYERCMGAVSPAGWIHATLTLPAPRYINLEEYKRARYANALRNGPGRYRDEHYLHLLDGGLADNQGIHSLTEALVSTHSPVELLRAINLGRVKRILVIAVNARSDADSKVGQNEAVPGLLKVVNTVIGTPIDATTAYANASLQELVNELRSAGASQTQMPGSPLFTGLRVYAAPIDFDQFLPEQVALQVRVKDIGTTWTLSPHQVQDAVDAGRLLLRQHPCYQRLLLDIGSATSDGAQARRNCPFPEDGA